MDENRTDQLDIDEIVREIRTQIVKPQRKEHGAAVDLNVFGKEHAPGFYEALYQAWLLHNEMEIQLTVRPSTLPIVGRLITSLRALVHNVVIFYVQKLLVQQKAINEQLIIALSELSKDSAPDPSSSE